MTTTRTIDPVLVQALLDEIGNGFFHVKFLKKDGTEKDVPRARLNVTSRMANNDKSDAARATLAAHQNVPYVDLSVTDGKGWRCFNLAQVTYLRGAGQTL